MTWVDCYPPRQLTANFSSQEYMCQCGNCSGGRVDLSHVNRIQMLRDIIGVPFKIISGCRCADHNRKVGGAVGSLHTLGKATDLRTLKAPFDAAMRYRIVEAAIQLEFAGIGIRSTSIHLDDGDHKKIWTYGDT